MNVFLTGCTGFLGKVVLEYGQEPPTGNLL